MAKNNKVSQYLEDLNSEDVATRSYALEDLGDFITQTDSTDPVTNKEIINKLVSCLGDPDPNVIDITIRVLKNCPPKQATSSLLPYLNNSDIKIRTAVLDILQGFGSGKEILSQILPYTRHVIDDVRIFSLDILTMNADESCFDSIKLCLTDPNPNVVLRAYECLGTINNQEAKEILKATLENPDTERDILGISLIALGKTEDTAYLDAILNFPDENIGLLGFKMKALGFGRSKAVVHYLTKQLENKQTPSFIKASALWAISNIATRDPEVLLAAIDKNYDLSDFFQTTSASIMTNAITLVGVLKPSGYLDLLNPFFKHQDPKVRMAALLAIGHDSQPKATSMKLLLEYDSNSEVAEMARCFRKGGNAA